MKENFTVSEPIKVTTILQTGLWNLFVHEFAQKQELSELKFNLNETAYMSLSHFGLQKNGGFIGAKLPALIKQKIAPAKTNKNGPLFSILYSSHDEGIDLYLVNSFKYASKTTTNNQTYIAAVNGNNDFFFALGPYLSYSGNQPSVVALTKDVLLMDHSNSQMFQNEMDAAQKVLPLFEKGYSTKEIIGEYTYRLKNSLKENTLDDFLASLPNNLVATKLYYEK